MSAARYIPGIDGLRAWAVLSVIFFHLGCTGIPGGFTGVDVFFVISGYVVTASLVASGTRSGRFADFALNFYARRVLRIYPALVVCLLVSVWVQTLLVPASWLSASSEKTAISAFFGFSNFTLISSNDGYFSPRVEFNAFTHTWSLAVEEQFYLLFPALFYIWFVGRKQAGIRGMACRVLLPLIFVASFFFARHETMAAFDRAYYLLPSRFWELLAGALLSLAHLDGRLKARHLLVRQGMAFLGLGLIVLGVLYANKLAFPYPWALLPVGGALMVITALASESSQTAWPEWLLSNPLMVLVGKLSYSLYLWHWPTFVFFKWTVGLNHGLYQFVALAVTIVLASLSYQFLEKPIRHGVELRRFSSRRIVAGGMALVFVLALSAWGTQKAQSQLSLSVTRNKVDWYPKPWPGTSGPVDATAPRPLAGRTLFVIGDSHAGAFATMMQMLREHQGMNVREFSKGGCHVASLAQRGDTLCAQHLEGVLSTVRQEAKTGDMVMLASLRVPRWGDQWSTFDADEVRRQWASTEAERERALALQEADQLISQLESMDLSVVMNAPMPVFPSPPFRCSDWFNKANPVCAGGLRVSRNETLRHRQPIMGAMAELQVRHPRLKIWDPFDVLCPGAQCQAISDGRPLFFDGDHLSAVGNRQLFPSFVATITKPRDVR